jgi:glycerophosphoryl diester phosphodiesterase
VVDVVRAEGIEARTMIQSFDWRTLRAVQRIAPEIPTVCLTVESSWLDNLMRGRQGATPWTAGFDVDDFGGSVPDLVVAAGCRVWSPEFGDLGTGELARAHELGLEVIVWTVNERGDMARLIEMGVDGIITDYPDRLREVMAVRGMALPEPSPLSLVRGGRS